jgi:hypothetical protein
MSIDNNKPGIKSTGYVKMKLNDEDDNELNGYALIDEEEGRVVKFTDAVGFQYLDKEFVSEDPELLIKPEFLFGLKDVKHVRVVAEPLFAVTSEKTIALKNPYGKIFLRDTDVAVFTSTGVLHWLGDKNDFEVLYRGATDKDMQCFIEKQEFNGCLKICEDIGEIVKEKETENENEKIKEKNIENGLKRDDSSPEVVEELKEAFGRATAFKSVDNYIK